jgi:hypothetical protein
LGIEERTMIQTQLEIGINIKLPPLTSHRNVRSILVRWPRITRMDRPGRSHFSAGTT